MDTSILWIIFFWAIILGIPGLIAFMNMKHKKKNIVKKKIDKKIINGTFIIFGLIAWYAGGIIGFLVVVIIFFTVQMIDKNRKP